MVYELYFNYGIWKKAIRTVLLSNSLLNNRNVTFKIRLLESLLWKKKKKESLLWESVDYQLLSKITVCT